MAISRLRTDQKRHLEAEKSWPIVTEFSPRGLIFSMALPFAVDGFSRPPPASLRLSPPSPPLSSLSAFLLPLFLSLASTQKTTPTEKKTGQQKNSLKNVPAATPRRQLVGRLRRPGRQLVAGLARPQPLLRHGARRVHAGRLPDEPARRRRRSRRGPPRLPRGQQQPSLCRIGRPSPQQGRRRQARDGEQAGTDQGQGQERAAGG